MPSPQDPYEHSELQRLLEAAIGDLTRRQRAALLLKDVHGLSLVEVAACLDLTPGSVEVLLARARRAFRARFEERCTAAGRPLPRSSGGLTALPLLPLPAGLSAPACPLTLPLAPPAHLPPAHLPPAATLCPPLTVAAGSGIGAALGLPASVKTAVLVAAAAATMGTAEIAVTQADHRPPPAAADTAALVVSAPEVAAPAAAASGSSRARATAAPSPTPTATPSPSVVASPVVSASPTQVAEPTPQGSPLAIATPSPEPSATPTATPTAHATAPPATPSPAPSPTMSPTSSASPPPAATP